MMYLPYLIDIANVQVSALVEILIETDVAGKIYIYRAERNSEV